MLSVGESVNSNNNKVPMSSSQMKSLYKNNYEKDSHLFVTKDQLNHDRLSTVFSQGDSPGMMSLAALEHRNSGVKKPP